MTQMALTPAPLLYDARTTAKALAISGRTLCTLTQQGSIPSVKIGRLRRYCPQRLQDWILQQAQQPAMSDTTLTRHP